MKPQSTYDRTPFVPSNAPPDACVLGWDAIAHRLQRALADRGAKRPVLTIECYPGVHAPQILQALTPRLQPALALDTRDALWPPDRIESLVHPFLGGDDPVFGFLSGLTLPQFFDPAAVAQLQRQIEHVRQGLILLVGVGARLIAPGDLFVYADLSRWEAQNRFRRHETGNLGANNRTLPANLLYKRAFFVDWRVADRWKRPLIRHWDCVLDTHDALNPKLADGTAVRRGLDATARRPFRVVPFFDPAPWGGQWMKARFDLDPNAPNYGWCFDGVPEENSLLLGFGSTRFEVPALDLVFDQPRALLGDPVHARFGDEFPIRFDFLDTMGGGNLSFQVHPLTEYIHQTFGMHYTQDESYYLLDAGPGASVYLGLREGIHPRDLRRDLETAQAGVAPFNADRYANRWPARKHDHFLIPAGTVHCSGAQSMVLEISATPYLFTFKLWDWGRLGLDGQPRPIHLDHGLANIQWDRTTDWTRAQLINRIQPLAAGPGWREERTGLHEREFIETRRHWFSQTVRHDPLPSVQVLNLVEGAEAIVESPDRAFDPFLIHYAETFILPAAAGPYTLRPHGPSIGQECATMKAFVRTGL